MFASGHHAAKLFNFNLLMDEPAHPARVFFFLWIPYARLGLLITVLVYCEQELEGRLAGPISGPASTVEFDRASRGKFDRGF